MLIEVNGSSCIENIRYLRKKYAVSRRALAKLAGMSEITLRMLEEGTIAPIFRNRELKRMCSVFDVSLEDFIEKDLSEPKNE